MSNAPEVFTTVDVPESLGPSLWGLEPYQIVSISMLVLIAVLVWKKVPGLITGGLDARIAAIKEQLEEAKSLRAEAEALRDEYSRKIAGAEKDAEAMMENAQREADALLEKAEADSKTLVERRKRMAEDTIAAAEREAVQDVRNRAAAAAAAASRKLIAAKHDAEADRKLADELIAGL
ncbi:hypothetical protein PF049_10330 [Erythrobacteraceae bacterium WH01K]|nr:hypothetical protein PF049_10330 [Erythrobacteraceae bacterium WH01K]